MGAAALLAAGCAQVSSPAPSGANVILNGNQEVPPVSTAATGTGTIRVLMDRSVSGSVRTSGVAATAAHIHQGAPGQNGPVIVTLIKLDDNTWAVPSGTTLTPAQNDAYWAGMLYVNVHTNAHQGGEVRAQLKPYARAAVSGS